MDECRPAEETINYKKESGQYSGTKSTGSVKKAETIINKPVIENPIIQKDTMEYEKPAAGSGIGDILDPVIE